ncbi:MAG: GFA family protein [Myxococcota bacterium]
MRWAATLRAMAMKTYQGSCHCKRVRFEATLDLMEGTGKCNCTNCWKKRAWTARVKPEDFRALGNEQELSGYKPDSADGHHGGFCKHCGVLTYAWVEKTEWNPTTYVSVSVAALDGLDPAELIAAPVTYYDGLANNWWNPPAETRHL